MTNPIQSTSLYCREGSSDKKYHAAIEPKVDGFIVTFAYGRRGSTLTVGTKTPAPVSLEQATQIHGKLVSSKLAKGYTYGIHGYQPARQSGDEGRDSGDHWLETRVCDDGYEPLSFLIPPEAMEAACRADRGSLVAFTAFGGRRSRDLGLSIQSGGIEASSVFPTLDPKEFPERPEPMGALTVVPPATLQGLAHVAGCAASDTTRAILNGVFFTPEDGGRLVATDGTAFNARYLADALEIGGTLCFSDELSPGICRHPTGRFCVIMPMRVTIPAPSQNSTQHPEANAA